MPKLYSALSRGLGLRSRLTGGSVEAMESRTLLSVSMDPNGYTQIAPAPDARVIYVSSSTGSDNNDGLSPDSPIASVSLGIGKLRDHSGDQLLLKCGDVWHTDLGTWRKSGKSADQPLVIGAYGAGARPELMTGDQPGFMAGAISSPEIDHIAIMGIHFYADGRDPASPTYVGAVNRIGVDVITKTDGFLVEDCEIDGYVEDINVEQYLGPIEKVSIRNNVIINAYAVNGHSQGIYCNGITNLLIEGNLFDHDGYNDTIPGAGATWYNHDAYLSSNNVNVTVQNNIFAEASAYGLEARSGGLVQNNLFLNDPMGMTYGLVNGASVTPGGVNGIVNGNVFVGGGYIGNLRMGGGMEVSNIKAGYPTVISNNIFTQSIDRAPAAITLTYGLGDTNAQDAVGVNDLTLQGNIVYDWYRGIHVDGGFAAGGAGLKAFNNVRVQENDFQDIPGPVLTHDDPLYKGQETWTGNRYSSGVAQMLDGKKDLPTQQWDQSNEPGAQVVQVPYANPLTTVESYDAAWGGPGTIADFVAQAESNSRNNWLPQYEAQSVIAWFRSGFEETGATPHDWRAPTPPIASAAMPAAVLDHDSSAEFTVTYTDDKAVDPSSIASGGVSVTANRGKWSTPAALVGISGQGATITATYSFTPVGGLFHKGRTQKLSVMVNAGQVKDNEGFPVTAGAVGTFKLRVLTRPKPPTVRSVKLVNRGAGLIVRFSSDVSASLSVGDLVLQSDAGQTIDPSLMTLSTDGVHKTALWTFSGEPDGQLPAGSWHVRLLAATVADAGGRQLDGNRDGIGGDDYVLKGVLEMVVK